VTAAGASAPRWPLRPAYPGVAERLIQSQE